MIEKLKKISDRNYRKTHDGLSKNETVYISYDEKCVILDRIISDEHYQQFEYYIKSEGIVEKSFYNNGCSFDSKSVKTRVVDRNNLIPAVRKKLENIEFSTTQNNT